MEKEILTQEVYDSYLLRSYLDSILCSNDVITTVNSDYKNEIIEERELLTLIYNYVNENPGLCILTSKIYDNIYKILSCVNKSNIDILNDIKCLLNSAKVDMEFENSFFIFQYIARRYSVIDYNKLTILQQYELQKNGMQFFLSIEDKICDSISFDYKLINLVTDDEQSYDECLNNPNFLLSLNYFKCAYPDIFKDAYSLYFFKSILEFQSLNNLNLNNDYKVFGDLNECNAKLLKYVKKEIKKYG